MTRAVILFLIIGACLMTNSCHSVEHDNYPKNPKWSHENGEPIDSLTSYFPDSIKIDSTSTKTLVSGLDTALCKDFSKLLYYLKEPLLFNYYIKHEEYRVLYECGIMNSVVCISLNKEGDKVWLNTKILDKDPLNPPLKHTTIFVPPVSVNKNGHHIKRKAAKLEVKVSKEDSLEDIKLMKYYLTKPKIVVNQTKVLSIKEWNEFKELIKECNFWKMPNFNFDDGIMDGSDWIIEAHMKDKYWFAQRHSPRDNFQECGKYLAKLSGYSEKIH